MMENKTDFISLKDFVKGTISDIAEAIKELNTGDDLVVNPYDRHFPNGCREDTIAGNGAYISYVEFNVEIASVESTQNEGGVTIKVLSGNVGKKQSNESSSTIRFTLPVVFPPGRVKPMTEDPDNPRPCMVFENGVVPLTVAPTRSNR